MGESICAGLRRSGSVQQRADSALRPAADLVYAWLYSQVHSAKASDMIRFLQGLYSFVTHSDPARPVNLYVPFFLNRNLYVPNKPTNDYLYILASLFFPRPTSLFLAYSLRIEGTPTRLHACYVHPACALDKKN
jgi:hypothetical protein